MQPTDSTSWPFVILGCPFPMNNQLAPLGMLPMLHLVTQLSSWPSSSSFACWFLLHVFFSSSQATLKRYRTVLPFNLPLILGIGWGHPRDGLPQIHQTNTVAIIHQHFILSNPNLCCFSPSFFFGVPGLPMFSGPLQEGVLEVPPGGGRLIQVLEDWWRHRSLMTLSYVYIYRLLLLYIYILYILYIIYIIYIYYIYIYYIYYIYMLYIYILY